MNYDEAKKYLYNDDINVEVPEKESEDLYMAVTDDRIQDGLQLIKSLTSCDDNTSKLLWVDLKCDFGTKENNPIIQAREEYQKEKQMKEYNATPKCPKCGSTNIQIVKRGFKITTGFLGAGKNERVCANCMKKF